MHLAPQARKPSQDVTGIVRPGKFQVSEEPAR